MSQGRKVCLILLYTFIIIYIIGILLTSYSLWKIELGSPKDLVTELALVGLHQGQRSVMVV